MRLPWRVPSRRAGIDAEALRAATRLRPGRPGEKAEAPQLRLERLNEVGVLSLFLHSAGTREELLSLFLERSPRATGAVVTYPLLLDRRRDVLEAAALAHIEDAGLEQASIAANENLADLEFPLPLRGWRRSVLEAGEVVVVDDLREPFAGALSEEACDSIRRRLGITKVAAVPLVMEGESLGLCLFLFSGETPDVEVLELLAGHCTLALKALTASEETTRFGGIDPVTWAYSRGYFLEALEAEVVRARRYGRGLSLIAFDLDDFAAFNGSYGHTTGDRLLRAFAMLLAGAVAPPELVARSGADEFVLLLPETDRAAAVELTSAVMRQIGSLPVFEGADEKYEPTATVAIVSYPEEGSSREELLASLELAMEHAKEERRAASARPKEMTPVQNLRLAGRRHSA